MFVIASSHPTFGKLFLGRGRPVATKKAALRFPTEEAAADRIAFWQGLLAKGESLSPTFFSNMQVESAE